MTNYQLIKNKPIIKYFILYGSKGFIKIMNSVQKGNIYLIYRFHNEKN